MGVVLYAGSSRSRTVEPDRTTRHSFSFGAHYDPANLGFGPLVAHNDDEVAPGGGYPDHPHRDLDIVTWVLDGALLHTDSLGHRSVLGPGTVQVQSAGSGIRHAETVERDSGPTRFVQAWLRPDEPGLPPQRHLAGGDAAAGRGLVAVAGGSGLPLGVAGARLLVARLGAGEEVTLPGGSRQHVFVATGEVALSGPDPSVATGGQGDAWRIADAPGLRLRASAASEVLVWDFA
jgi:redox-sensitive bicupin YhaK (pirin superfamily)